MLLLPMSCDQLTRRFEMGPDRHVDIRVSMILKHVQCGRAGYDEVREIAAPDVRP